MRVLPTVSGDNNPITGTLPGSSPFVVTLPNNYVPPLTVYLSSAAANSPKIEFSADGGNNYFTPILDVTTGTAGSNQSSSTIVNLVVSLGPLTNVRFTGANGNAYGVL